MMQRTMQQLARSSAATSRRAMSTMAAAASSSSWQLVNSTRVVTNMMVRRAEVTQLSRFLSSSSAAATVSKTTGKVLDYKDAKYKKYVKLQPGQKLVILGFGAIGQGVLPLLFRHIDMTSEQVVIISNEFSEKALAHAADYKAKTVVSKLTRTDYQACLNEHVKKGDFLVNLSVDVSSIALIEHCQKVGALYMDTCNEPWAGGYSDPNQPAAARSNYAFREQALALRQSLKKDGPTALITHGANPGLVSHFVKKALLNIARDTGVSHKTPRTREDWVDLAETLGIKVIHIAEKDTQASDVIKHDGEFVNTWSIEGYCEEGKQPAELGWGTHEKRFPADGRHHKDGCKAAIYLDRPGANTLVRTWTPKCGVFHGMLITHTEAISIADYWTKTDKSGNIVYRPTVHFAYHPCPDAIMSMKEVAYQEWVRHPVERVMIDEVRSGRDELGVLLMGHKKGAYWYGSNLTIDEARRVAPNNNATSLQVCTGVLSGVVWTLENPQAGLIEPEEMAHVERVLEISAPYLGELDGFYNEKWTPLHRRGLLFPEPQLDHTDPWQFDNFRV